jgi:anti-repressor protein
MNENLNIWEYEQHEIRTIEKDGEPWFVGKDVATVLGYMKPRNAIANHVDDEDKMDAPIQGALGGTQNMTVINESGLYSLIFPSKLPTAKEFQSWIFHDVLPSIRRNGVYMTEDFMEYALKHPDFAIYLLQNYKVESQASIKQKI